MDGYPIRETVPKSFCVTMENLKSNSEVFVAVGSFLAAVGLAFTSLMISADHDIAAGVLMMCAQFLTLTAAIFGLDYKFKTWTKRMRGGEK